MLLQTTPYSIHTYTIRSSSRHLLLSSYCYYYRCLRWQSKSNYQVYSPLLSVVINCCCCCGCHVVNYTRIRTKRVKIERILEVIIVFWRTDLLWLTTVINWYSHFRSFQSVDEKEEKEKISNFKAVFFAIIFNFKFNYVFYCCVFIFVRFF